MCAKSANILLHILVTLTSCCTVLSARPRLWVFGDSASDTGNLGLMFAADRSKSTFLPPEAYPPYQPIPGNRLRLQRVCNGAVIAEHIASFYNTQLLPSLLARRFGAGRANNFAIFAAQARATSPIDFPYQVAQLARANVQVSNDRALIFIGANDVFSAWQAAIAPMFRGRQANIPAGRRIIDQAIRSVRQFTLRGPTRTTMIPAPTQEAIRRGSPRIAVPSLSRMGLRRFVFINSADLSQAPSTAGALRRLGPAATRSGIRAMETLVRYYNAEYQKVANALRNELRGVRGSEVRYLDMFSVGRRIVRDFRQLGFTNRNQACFNTNTLQTFTTGAAPRPRTFTKPCSRNSLNKFVFLDVTHPSAAVHRLAARQMIGMLRSG